MIFTKTQRQYIFSKLGHTYQKWIIFVHYPWRQSNAKMSLLSVHQDYCTSHSSLSTHRLLNCRDTEKQLITAAHDGGVCDARFIILGYLHEGVCPLPGHRKWLPGGTDRTATLRSSRRWLHSHRTRSVLPPLLSTVYTTPTEHTTHVAHESLRDNKIVQLPTGGETGHMNQTLRTHHP